MGNAYAPQKIGHVSKCCNTLHAATKPISSAGRHERISCNKSATESVWETVYVRRAPLAESEFRKLLFNEFFLSSFLSKIRKCLLQGVTMDFTKLVLEL